jgi:hypothetical protein
MCSEQQGLGGVYNDFDLFLGLREAGFRNMWADAELLHNELAGHWPEVTAVSRYRPGSEAGWTQSWWCALIAENPTHKLNSMLNLEEIDLAWPVCSLAVLHSQCARKANKS